MVKLQHETRRGPNEFISVGGTVHELDADGCVEVPQESAEKMLHGAKWKTPETWARIGLPAALASTGGAAGRRARTREELEAAAKAEGIKVEKKEPAKVEPIPPVEEETVEVSMSMSKTEMLGVAVDMGIDVSHTMTKRQLLEAISEASQEE